MAITMNIVIQEDATGINTNISAMGACSSAEAEHAKYIHQAIISAIKGIPGFKYNDAPVCKTTEINHSANGDNENVH
ncbi:hypothetical protein ACSFCW_23900 [Yokenella regensburgei]|uniref:hypothetical protein n=1 Tax=Yokenella regensburgei TaxID=158877 RepID=UPI003ED90B39